MSGATGTKRIIQSYIDHGGATMDEDKYQLYRIAVLSKWLDECPIFKTYEMNQINMFGHPIEKALARYGCLLCIGPTEFTVDEAISHLKVHKPEYFEGEEGKLT